jgi:hypothetical protein
VDGAILIGEIGEVFFFPASFFGLSDFLTKIIIVNSWFLLD